MTSRQLVQSALAGESTPRFPAGPLAVHNTAALCGVSIEDYTHNPEVMVDCICRYYERFRPDAVWLSADTWVTAEAMGAEVDYPGAGQPMGGTGKTLVQSVADIERLPAPDPGALGRMPKMLEAMRLLRQRLGEDVFVVACFDQSPFSLACALADINEMMMLLVTDPPFVEALMERCIEHASAYAIALGHAGADMLSSGDSPAGMIGPELYEEFALPAQQRTFEVIRAQCAVPTSLHICGDSTHILSSMATSGADVLEVDHLVRLDEACRLVPDKIALWGNINPVSILNAGSPEMVRSACHEAVETVRRHKRRRFVLSSGCTLAPDTPPENIEALVEAGRESGLSDSQESAPVVS